jgi:hypothetical protein
VIQRTAIAVANHATGILSGTVVYRSEAENKLIDSKDFEAISAWVGESFGYPLKNYPHLIEEGVIPVVYQQLEGSIDKIRDTLARNVESKFERIPESCALEFEAEMRVIAVVIADMAHLLSVSRCSDIWHYNHELSDKEFALINNFVAKHVGTALTGFRESLESGINPITLLPLGADE